MLKTFNVANERPLDWDGWVKKEHVAEHSLFDSSGKILL